MPLTSDALAAQQVQERLRALQQMVHEIDKKRQQSEQGLINLQKLSAGQDDKSSQHFSMKLKAMYKNCIAHSEQEEDILRKALENIAEIRNIKNEQRRIQNRRANNKEIIRSGTRMRMLYNQALILPLFVSKVGERPPPLCGAIPSDSNYVAQVGDMVVAWVKLNEKDGEQWIVAEVVGYNHSTNEYEVYDIFKEQNHKTRHTLSKSWVIPLPLMRANPETDPGALFPKGALVMALYPTTSCFYKALVNRPPQTHSDQYELIFEDPNYTVGHAPPVHVAQRYVIAYKQKPNQS